MGTKSIFWTISIIIICANCSQSKARPDKVGSSLEDSALDLYLKKSDSLFKESPDFWGNNKYELDYAFLKALSVNDTAFLREVILDSRVESENLLLNHFREENIPNLMEGTLESSIQFEYNETFCDELLVVTLQKDSNNILSTFIRWKPVLKQEDSFQYVIIEKEKVNLTSKQWDSIETHLLLADFWNLRNRNTDYILDPSFLTIRWVERGNNGEISKYKSIKRTVFRNTALYSAFLLALKYSLIRLPCD